MHNQIYAGTVEMNRYKDCQRSQMTVKHKHIEQSTKELALKRHIEALNSSVTIYRCFLWRVGEMLI
jgi:hypothetical protein